ncbi:pseudaminic acid cytidylyltransferase [Agarivorans sp. Alg241-V36]|uniref:pseudaminic acid cytidylyltransferase n=1 Tax=Agarivorans sp. Alg241-V36 TaxID=2305992 RepID=UPI0013D152AA|nr:pseudaminic acid cytidylyltransferase [Agarivorans sp. Alg241-V36]
MKRIAIIPARGGSKRIPKKNIRQFRGQPIIAYSIQSALESDCFDQVIVSTDSTEIASIAESYGASVPFLRPANLSNDFAGTVEVIQHALKQPSIEQELDYVCCIYATAPFVQASHLRKGLELLIQQDSEYCYPVCEYPSPIQRALAVDNNGHIAMAKPEAVATRSQDLQAHYYDTGQFYWGTRNAFIAAKPILSSLASPLVLPKGSVVDIDDPDDWRLAELIYQHRILEES